MDKSLELDPVKILFDFVKKLNFSSFPEILSKFEEKSSDFLVFIPEDQEKDEEKSSKMKKIKIEEKEKKEEKFHQNIKWSKINDNNDRVLNQNFPIFTWIDRRDLIFYLIRIINYCYRKKKLNLKFKIDDSSLGNLIILSQLKLHFNDENELNFNFGELICNSNRREFSPNPNFLRYIFKTEILEYLAYLNFKNKNLILRIADVNFD
uniref:Uncharacterized protein n=1 Tax=Romanomermis culicivorax TaxID=13658 RepID=A0A915IYB7_ROMCU